MCDTIYAQRRERRCRRFEVFRIFPAILVCIRVIEIRLDHSGPENTASCGEISFDVLVWLWIFVKWGIVLEGR